VRSASTSIRLAASEVIHLILARFRELGSARQVLLSMTVDQIHFPRPPDDEKLVTFDWTPISLSQCDLGAQKPLLRRSLRLRKK
jgi:hypothetical protein